MFHKKQPLGFLARDALVRTNRRAIAMMFVRLSVRMSDCLSVRPLSGTGTGVHCDHMVRFSADSSLRFNVLGTLTPKHVHIPSAVFSSSTCKRGGVWTCKLGEEFNAKDDK